MSVIVKDMESHTVKILTKGADSVIKERLDDKNEQNMQFMKKT